jgi:hypothetical protein
MYHQREHIDNATSLYQAQHQQWRGAVVATLQRYKIIDVHVQPEVHIIDADVRVSYIDDEGDGESKEATEFFSREGRTSHSCPMSKAPSRKSSLSARSLNSIDKGAK